MQSTPRFNYHKAPGRDSSVQMEWLSRQYIDAIKQSSKALLKAQLLSGQHTLDKDRFVYTAKHHGWILQIPAQLL